MDSSSGKSNKIRDIVRLQQMIKKWKKLANTNTNTTTTTTTNTTTAANLARSASSSGSKSIKFLKKTLSFSELSNSFQTNATAVPKGYMAVCVGKELKRFVIPTEYLSHGAFAVLLREAEEEFGFQQEGVLKLPCDVELFEKVLKMMMDNNNNKRLSTSSASSVAELLTTMQDDVHKDFIIACGGNGFSPDHSGLGSPSLNHLQMCR